jgi:hypothetical protein
MHVLPARLAARNRLPLLIEAPCKPSIVGAVAPDFFPRLASGQVYFAPPDGKWEFSGTGAMYVRPYVILTAAHCVPDVPGAKFAFWSPVDNSTHEVEKVVRHPRIDLAVLVLPRSVEPPPTGVYTAISQSLIDGGDFLAFGYPAEENTTKPRIFKGHFQRFFGYQSTDGRAYFAAELSIPAPAGLSGGPVSNAHQPQFLNAIVTANHDSSVVIDSFEEHEQDGTVTRGKITRVVSYGIAAMLVGETVQSWINTAVIDAG